MKNKDSFTTKDIDKIKKALEKAGAKPLRDNDIVEFTWDNLQKMSRWADNVLETAEKLHRQCNKN